MNRFFFVGAAHGLVVLSLLVACGDDVDPNPNPRRNQTDASTSSPLGLSAGFAGACARCHGDSGEGSSAYPRLPGSKDEAGYIAIVRAGKGDMPIFDVSQITDADLKADFALLKAR